MSAYDFFLKYYSTAFQQIGNDSLYAYSFLSTFVIFAAFAIIPFLYGCRKVRNHYKARFGK